MLGRTTRDDRGGLMALPFWACMIATAAFCHLPPRVLPSILAVEGGHVGSIGRHRNGTFDLG